MSETFHVLPIDDRCDHEDVQDSCACGPYTEFFTQGKVIVHHPLEGRHAEDPSWPRRWAAEVALENSLSEEELA
jgi:hypothetical protein